MEARVKWWTNVDQSKIYEKINKNTRLRKDYTDVVPTSSLLSNVPDIVRHNDETISINQKDIDGIENILKQSQKIKCIDNDNRKKDSNFDPPQFIQVSCFYLSAFYYLSLAERPF
jgi:hypothetical protein